MSSAIARIWPLILLPAVHQIASASDLAPVQITENQGFIDINLPITAVNQEAGQVRITARGAVDGAVVGFEVDFPTTTKQPQGLLHPLRFGTARIRSVGRESDNFVALLAKEYGVANISPKMLPFVDASATGLGESKEAVLSGKKNSKFFFFDSGPENRYAELFINVDFDNRLLEFHEKDQDYRKPLLLDLTKAP